MAKEGVDIERLREHVRTVVVGRDVLDLDDAESFELADLEEAPVDVARALARLAIARQLDGAGTTAIEALPVVGAPSGAQLLTRGGLNIKRNGPSNLFGAFGDVYLILGKFTLQAS